MRFDVQLTRFDCTRFIRGEKWHQW